MNISYALSIHFFHLPVDIKNVSPKYIYEHKNIQLTNAISSYCKHLSDYKNDKRKLL